MVFNLNSSSSGCWEDQEIFWKEKFQDIIQGTNQFVDLKSYYEFLDITEKISESKQYNQHMLENHLDIPEKILRNEIHTLFPAEKEDYIKERLSVFDLQFLVFENESKLFWNFINDLMFKEYQPVIISIDEIITICKSLIRL